jgi:hypothetical protein
LLFIGGSLSDFFSSSLKKADGVHLWNTPLRVAG